MEITILIKKKDSNNNKKMNLHPVAPLLIIIFLTMFFYQDSFSNAKVKTKNLKNYVHAVIRNYGYPVSGPCDHGGSDVSIHYSCGPLNWTGPRGKFWGAAESWLDVSSTGDAYNIHHVDEKKGFSVSAGGNYFPPLPIDPPDSLGYCGCTFSTDFITTDSINRTITLSGMDGFVRSSMPNYTSVFYVIVYWGTRVENDSMYHEDQIISKSYLKVENLTISTAGIFSPSDVTNANVLYYDSIANETDTTLRSTLNTGLNKVIHIPEGIPMDSIRVDMFGESGYGPFLEWKLIIPSASILNLRAYIEGFYNPLSNNMTGDTVRVYLRNNSSPYAIVDSSKAVLNSSGNGAFSFSNVTNGIPYYIILKHRNSIETWSSSGNPFYSNTLLYDFSTALSKAYGSNMKQVDNSPVTFAVYGGDLNKDGFVNLVDVIQVTNAASSFSTGYVIEDLNGSNTVNLGDILIVYNNSNNFVVKITP